MAVLVHWAGPGAVVLVTCGVWVLAHSGAWFCLCQPVLSAVGPEDGSGQQREPGTISSRQIRMRTPLWGVSRRTEFSHMDTGCAIKLVLRGRELALNCCIFYSKAGLLISVLQCQALRQNAFTALCIQDVILMLGSCCRKCHSELQEDCLCPQNLKLE